MSLNENDIINRIDDKKDDEDEKIEDEKGINEGEGEKNELSNPKIMFDSEEFDPNLVLFGPPDLNIQLPVPEAKIFNNLAEYYHKTFPNKSIAKASSTEPTIPFKRQLPMPTPVPRKPKTNVLIKMEEASKGPLSILYRSINQYIRILIRRKKACPIREERFGWIIGLLIAFDKHFNVTLGDATEEYKHRYKGIDVVIRKKMKNIFIRGDNVVLVTSISKHNQM